MTNTTRTPPSPDELARAQEVLELSKQDLRDKLIEARRHREDAMSELDEARARLNRVLASAMRQDMGLTATKIATLAKVGRSKLYSLPAVPVRDLPKFHSAEELSAALVKAGQDRIEKLAASDSARADALAEVVAAARLTPKLLDVTEITDLVGIDRTMAYRTADAKAVAAALAEIEGS